MQSMYTSGSALSAGMQWLDRISNNIANQNTVGYAEQTGTFADMFTQALQQNQPTNSLGGRYTPPGWWGGTGVFATGVQSDFSTMPLEQTGVSTNLAIQGDGFFVVKGDNGQTMLTKAGDFEWSKTASGKFQLATPNGNPVLDIHGQPIIMDSNPGSQMAVGPDGQITYGSTKGQKIAIASVSVPSQSLQDAGNNEFTVNQGYNVKLENGTNQASTSSSVVQGALSMSNVDLTSEMTNMVQAERFFELNSEALQITNKMQETANTIRS